MHAFLLSLTILSAIPLAFGLPVVESSTNVTASNAAGARMTSKQIVFATLSLALFALLVLVLYFNKAIWDWLLTTKAKIRPATT